MTGRDPGFENVLRNVLDLLCSYGLFQNLEEQVAQEEGTSQALKEEAVRRENGLQQLRAAVKEVRRCLQCLPVALNEWIGF